MSDRTLYRIDPDVAPLRRPYRIVRQADEMGDPVIGQLVPVEPPIDLMAGLLSTIEFTPAEEHPEMMRPIAAELWELIVKVDDE